MPLFSKKPKPRDLPTDPVERLHLVYSLSRPFIQWNQYPEDISTLGDVYEGGFQILGQTGSGKSSGSGKLILSSAMQSGMGMLLTTSKASDRVSFELLAAKYGRSEDVIVLEQKEDGSVPWTLDIFDYTFSRPGTGAGHTQSMVSLFSELQEVINRGQSNGGGESFWQHTHEQMLRNAIDLVVIATGKVDLPSIYRAITTAAQSDEEVHSADWRGKSYNFQLLQQGLAKDKTDRQDGDFAMTAWYWLEEFPRLSGRTRSVILAHFTSIADILLRGFLRDVFCSGRSNLLPELTHEGAIIILDLPVLSSWGTLGQAAQMIYKWLWQSATERRNVDQNPRPVLLWCDESQFFISEMDMAFVTTSRDYRAISVYLTQNLPNYYKMLGGSEKGKAAADSIVGTLTLKCFHCNTETHTNQWSADTIAQDLIESPSYTMNPFSGG